MDTISAKDKEHIALIGLRFEIWQLLYALGKLKAEKAAWTLAKETGLKLTRICPGLITGPEFCSRNPTATIAYLKGAQEMYQSGVLATMDVMRLAEAQVCKLSNKKLTIY